MGNERRSQNIDQSDKHHHEASDRTFFSANLVRLGDACTMRAHAEQRAACERRAQWQPVEHEFAQSCTKTPVMTTKIAVRSGVPPISPDTVMAKGVLIERGIRLRLIASLRPRRCASPHAESIADELPITTPTSKTGQYRRMVARC